MSYPSNILYSYTAINSYKAIIAIISYKAKKNSLTESSSNMLYSNSLYKALEKDTG